MNALFYDLETSDRNPVGQILNYAFLFVDNDFNVLDQCCGRMRITRLQLPSPDAILANRINVLEHNRDAEASEKEGLAAIWKFLAEKGAACREGLLFIGYNSSRFDLGFLRTSLIRNGLSPYFPNFVYGDLLHLSKKLFMSAPGFPAPKIVDREGPRVSLSLQALCQEFGLLHGAQEHESRADVLITIELARLYRQRFGLDVYKYQPYEALGLHRPGRFVRVGFPCYKVDATAHREEVVFGFHQADHRYSLWINLERYKNGEGRRALSWFKCKGDIFHVAAEHSPSPEEKELYQRAVSEFAEITVNNFFSESSCDIEQDIFRIDAQKLDLLRRAIWERDSKMLHASANEDLQRLYERHALANYSWGSGKDEKVKEKLSEYARYRYGGRMLLVKGAGFEAYREGIYSAHYHDTLGDLEARIDERMADASAEDIALLEALRSFYRDSDMHAVMAGEISRNQRLKVLEGGPVEFSN